MAEEMNPDFMEYQMDIDDPTITSSQAMSQPTCPYRPTADTPNALAAFQSGWSHNPHLDPSGPSFGSPSNPGGLYWAGMSPHSSSHLDPMSGGPSHQLSHSNRPGSAARYSLTPFNRTPDFASNQQRFLHPEDNNTRHPIPRMPDMDRFHNSHENRQGDSQNAGPMPSLSTGAPTYDEATQRRNEFMQAQMARSQQEAQANRNTRQPPTLTVQSTFFPTHLPQPNFTSNRSPSHFQGIQGSRVDTFQYSSRSMPGPPPAQAPPRQVSQFEQEQRRAWIHEANLASDYGEDSDDDSLDSFNTRLDQRERDLGLPPSQTRHAPAAAHGHRRPAMSSSEGEERELAMERSRAARRAAVAAAKLVASPAALASLEKVELSSLSGDDRSCIICYNEFGIKNPDGNIECAVRLPKCKHIFGDHCLKHWLKDSDSCPYCRDKLPSEPKKSHAEEMRRLFALNRPSGIPQQGAPVTPAERAAAQAALENRHAFLNSAQMQSQLHALYALEAQNRARVENAALEQSESIMRHNMQRQEDWGAMHPTHYGRPATDQEIRRRNRMRVASFRHANLHTHGYTNANANANNSSSSSSSGSSSARFSIPPSNLRGHNPGSGSSPTTNSSSGGPGAGAGGANANARNPAITNRNIFDTANTVAAVLGQPRSVTPHPSVLESGGAAAAPASASASGSASQVGGPGRRSSLPAGAAGDPHAPIRTPARDAAREQLLGLRPLQPVEQTPSPPSSSSSSSSSASASSRPGSGGDRDRDRDTQMTSVSGSNSSSSAATELFAASARVHGSAAAVWGAGRPVSETFVGVGGGGGFQAGVMDGGSARRWVGRG